MPDTFSLDEIGPPTDQQATPPPKQGQTFGLDDVAPPPNHPALTQGADTSWGSVPGQALRNAPSSMGRLLGNTWQAVRHPINTAEAIGSTALGAAQELDDALGLNAAAPKTSSEKQFDSVKDFYASRYGSAEGFKKALATDPIGVLADASSVLIGGESALARLPGLAGKVGKAAGTVGRNINPLNAPINAANATIMGANKAVNAVRDLRAPVSPELAATQYVAKRTPPEALDAFAQTSQGKPVLAAEATRQGITGMRALGLREGQTGDILGPTLEQRAGGTAGRIQDDFRDATGISPDAALGDIESIVKEGRKAAKPLYEKAFAGSGTGAFIQPLQDQFGAHSADVSKAASAVEDAERDATLAAAKVHRAGDNVYGANNALAEQRVAERQLETAQAAHQQASEARDSVLARLQQAQSDEANGVRGGVWSPRIQRFLDDPIMRRGLAQGMELERLEALEEDRPFNPREYAITGFDADGAPIISGVPNMRLLDAGKRGIDQLIKEQPKLPSGMPDMSNYRTQRLVGVKKAFLNEADRLNGDYGAARAEASDYLGAKENFDRGAKMFSNSNVTAKQFQEYLHGVGEEGADDFKRGLGVTDAEAFKGGVANWLFNKAQKGELKGAAFKQPIMKQKLTAIVGDADRADTFLAKMKAESDMAKTGARMAPGVNSTTFESTEAAAEQDHAGAAADALSAMFYLFKGKPIQALYKGVSAGRKTGAFAQTPTSDVPMRDAAGQMWMMPPADLAAHLRKAPPPPPPRPPRGLIPQGARLGLLGAAQAGQIANQAPYHRGGFV